MKSAKRAELLQRVKATQDRAKKVLARARALKERWATIESRHQFPPKRAEELLQKDVDKVPHKAEAVRKLEAWRKTLKFPKSGNGQGRAGAESASRAGKNWKAI